MVRLGILTYQNSFVLIYRETTVFLSAFVLFSLLPLICVHTNGSHTSSSRPLPLPAGPLATALPVSSGAAPRPAGLPAPVRVQPCRRCRRLLGDAISAPFFKPPRQCPSPPAGTCPLHCRLGSSQSRPSSGSCAEALT